MIIQAEEKQILQIVDISGAYGEPVEIMIEGDPSRIVMNNCHHVKLMSPQVSGQYAGPINEKRGLLEVMASSYVVIDEPGIFGKPDSSTKAQWIHTVPYGIIIHADSKHVEINEPQIFQSHVGIQARGQYLTVVGGMISRCSGDHIQLANHNQSVIGMDLVWSLEVLPYEQWHRDLIQIFAPPNSKNIQNITIQDCTLLSHAGNSDHKWSAAVQNILLSDGVGENITIENNAIHAANEIAILLNPCSHSKIIDNKIRQGFDGVLICGIEDRKGYGVACEGNIIENNIITNAVKREEIDMQNEEPLSFDTEIGILKNPSAPSITQDDYAQAAERLDLSVAMIQAVFTVESRKSGFNADGSVKILFERHIAYRECDKHGINPKAAMKTIGADVINKKPGGYKGSIAEYFRANKASTVDGHSGVDIAIRSASWGRAQIMGFNHKLAGYPTCLDMVRAFHESEVNHLLGFCSFLENTGLLTHLQKAEELIQTGANPRPALNKFANGYNGKNHKNYDVKIATEYRRLAKIAPPMKPLSQSRTVSGATGSLVGKTLGVGGLVELQSMLKEIQGAKTQIIETKASLEKDLADLDEAVRGDISDGQWLLWLIIAILILSKLGDVRVLWARVTDRWAGYH